MSVFSKISPKFLGELAWLLVKVIGKTLSIETVSPENDPVTSGRPCIYVSWHGRFFFPIICYRNRGIFALVSEHRDGKIIAAAVEAGGNKTVRGSTSKGGIRALAKLVKKVKDGDSIAFTPDGPRGPKWHFQPGAIYVAAKTGAPIVPLGGSARNAHYFKSWDSFQLPLPFSKGVFVVGEPYYITGGLEDDTIEIHRAELEKRLIELNKKADELVGANTE